MFQKCCELFHKCFARLSKEMAFLLCPLFTDLLGRLVGHTTAANSSALVYLLKCYRRLLGEDVCFAAASCDSGSQASGLQTSTLQKVITLALRPETHREATVCISVALGTFSHSCSHPATTPPSWVNFLRTTLRLASESTQTEITLVQRLYVCSLLVHTADSGNEYLTGFTSETIKAALTALFQEVDKSPLDSDKALRIPLPEFFAVLRDIVFTVLLKQPTALPRIAARVLTRTCGGASAIVAMCIALGDWHCSSCDDDYENKVNLCGRGWVEKERSKQIVPAGGQPPAGPDNGETLCPFCAFKRLLLSSHPRAAVHYLPLLAFAGVRGRDLALNAALHLPFCALHDLAALCCACANTSAIRMDGEPDNSLGVTRSSPLPIRGVTSRLVSDPIDIGTRRAKEDDATIQGIYGRTKRENAEEQGEELDESQSIDIGHTPIIKSHSMASRSPPRSRSERSVAFKKLETAAWKSFTESTASGTVLVQERGQNSALAVDEEDAACIPIPRCPCCKQNAMRIDEGLASLDSMTAMAASPATLLSHQPVRNEQRKEHKKGDLLFLTETNKVEYFTRLLPFLRTGSNIYNTFDETGNGVQPETLATDESAVFQSALARLKITKDAEEQKLKSRLRPYDGSRIALFYSFCTNYYTHVQIPWGVKSSRFTETLAPLLVSGATADMTEAAAGLIARFSQLVPRDIKQDVGGFEKLVLDEIARYSKEDVRSTALVPAFSEFLLVQSPVVLRKIIGQLLMVLGGKDVHSKTAVFLILDRIAKYNGIPFVKLISRARVPLCECLTAQDDVSNIRSVLEEIHSSFFGDSKFVEKCVPLLLPQLVLRDKLTAISDISFALGESVSKVCTENFSAIVAYGLITGADSLCAAAARNGLEREVGKRFNVLTTEISSSFPELLKAHLSSILGNLVLFLSHPEYGSHVQQTFELVIALQRLPGRSVEDFLGSYFFSIMDFLKKIIFENHKVALPELALPFRLNKAGARKSVKKYALRCFGRLFHLMRSKLGSVHVKVTGFLDNILSGTKGLTGTVLAVWSELVTLVDAATLNEMLQVVVATANMFCNTKYQQRAYNILEYAIITRKADLREDRLASVMPNLNSFLQISLFASSQSGEQGGRKRSRGDSSENDSDSSDERAASAVRGMKKARHAGRGTEKQTLVEALQTLGENLLHSESTAVRLSTLRQLDRILRELPKEPPAEEAPAASPTSKIDQLLRDKRRAPGAAPTPAVPVAGPTGGDADPSASNTVLDRVLAADVPLLSTLLKGLLVAVRENNQEIRELASACLGAVGAVETSRVEQDLKSQRNGDESSASTSTFLRQKFDEKDYDVESLGRELIQNYLLVYLQKNTSAQDLTGFVIQEILKTFGCQNDNAFWFSLSEQTRRIIEPYRISQYKINEPSKGKEHRMAFSSKISYTAWLKRWTTCLIERVQAISKVRPIAEAPIFHACRVLGDDKTEFFLVPLLTCCIVRYGLPEQVAKVREEMHFVLSEGNSVQAVKGLPPSDSTQLCIQCVFHIVDWLRKWAERQTMLVSAKRMTQLEANAKCVEVRKVEEFIGSVSLETMIRASRRCKAFARAFFNFELLKRRQTSSLTDKKLKTQDDFAMFQELYSELDEPDGLYNFTEYIDDGTPDAVLTDLVFNGDWAKALSLIDIEISKSPGDARLRAMRLKCLCNLGNFETAVTLALGDLARLSSPGETRGNFFSALLSPAPGGAAASAGAASAAGAVDKIAERGVQAAWELGDWDTLGLFCRRLEGRPSAALSWSTNVGRVFNFLHAGETGKALETIKEMRASRAVSLAAASLESYNRCFPHLVKLHALHEIEQVANIFQAAEKRFPIQPTPLRPQLIKASVLASSGLSESLREQEQEQEQGQEQEQRQQKPQQRPSGLLEAISSLVSTEKLGSYWAKRRGLTLDSFKTLSTILTTEKSLFALTGRYEDGAKLLVPIVKSARKAKQLQIASYFIQQAKMLGIEGLFIEEAKLEVDQDRYYQALDIISKGVAKIKASSPAPGSPAAKIAAKAILHRVAWEEESGNVISPRAKFAEAQAYYPNWEKSFFAFGNFMDKTFTRQFSDAADVHSLFVVLNEAISNYLKSLTLGSSFVFHSLSRSIVLFSKVGSAFVDGTLKRCEKELAGLKVTFMKSLEQIPPAVLLCGITHLIGRFCHKCAHVSETVKRYLQRVIENFPSQACWNLLILINSVNERIRAKAHELMVADSSFMQCIEFSKELMEIGQRQKETRKYLSLARDFKDIRQITNTKVVVPKLCYLTAVIPGKCGGARRDVQQTLPTVVRINDRIQVMHSMVQPKKIEIECSDGRTCNFLCKPKDDLRRDNRVMEIISVMNRLFDRDPECRRRSLGAVTFSAIPIREDAGIIEWVSDTITLRAAITAHSGNPGALESVRKAFARSSEPRLVAYEKALKTLGPPTLWRFFAETFSEPSAWLDARLNFTRTHAVVCMIGFAIGLGDRHLENILIRTTDGKVVHVDFNCIFWHGLTLPKPEVVPFRLTQNIVDAFGLTGYNGVFSKVAELTLGVLRRNRETLKGVLESFLIDPHVEWSSGSASSSAAKTARASTAYNSTKQSLTKFDALLKGSGGAFPLSVSAQVTQSILAAVDHENLSKMYEGWNPWA